MSRAVVEGVVGCPRSGRRAALVGAGKDPQPVAVTALCAAGETSVERMRLVSRVVFHSCGRILDTWRTGSLAGKGALSSGGDRRPIGVFKIDVMFVGVPFQFDVQGRRQLQHDRGGTA